MDMESPGSFAQSRTGAKVKYCSVTKNTWGRGGILIFLVTEASFVHTS